MLCEVYFDATNIFWTPTIFSKLLPSAYGWLAIGPCFNAKAVQNPMKQKT